MTKFLVFYYGDGSDPWRFGSGAEFVGAEVEADDEKAAAEKAWGHDIGDDLAVDEVASMIVVPFDSATVVEVTGVVSPEFRAATPKPSTAKRSPKVKRPATIKRSSEPFRPDSLRLPKA